MPTPTIECEYVGGPVDGAVRPAVVDPTGQPPAWCAIDAPDAMHRYDAERAADGRWRYRYGGPLRETMR